MVNVQFSMINCCPPWVRQCSIYLPPSYPHFGMCADTVEEFSVDKTYASCIIAGMNLSGRLKTGSHIGNLRSHFYFVYVLKGFSVDRCGAIRFNATKLVRQL